MPLVLYARRQAAKQARRVTQADAARVMRLDEKDLQTIAEARRLFQSKELSAEDEGQLLRLITEIGRMESDEGADLLGEHLRYLPLRLGVSDLGRSPSEELYPCARSLGHLGVRALPVLAKILRFSDDSTETTIARHVLVAIGVHATKGMYETEITGGCSFARSYLKMLQELTVDPIESRRLGKSVAYFASRIETGDRLRSRPQN